MVHRPGGRACLTEGKRQKYVQAIMDTVPGSRVHKGAEVASVSNSSGERAVTLALRTGEKVEYDHVILAYVHCHTSAVKELRGTALTRTSRGVYC